MKPARAGIAWLVIVVSAGIVFTLNFIGARSSGGAGAQSMMADLQSRIVVGAAQLPGAGSDLHKSMHDGLDPRNYPEVLRATVVTAEILGAEKGLEELEALNSRWDTTPPEPTADDRRLYAMLRDLYQARTSEDFGRRGLAEDASRDLETRLGWAGRLAVNPSNGPDPVVRDALLAEARQTAFVLFSVAGLAVIGFLAGLVVLAIWAALVATRTVGFQLEVGSGTGGFYAETFAIWFVVFFVLNVLFVRLSPPRWALFSAGVASAVSLLTLFWPVFRGVPWPQVRQEVGLTWPSGGWRDFAIGGLAYIAGAPLLAIGMLLTVALMKLQKFMDGTALLAFAEAPVHPIIEPLARGSSLERLQAIAVVLLVPITEEIMFRGVLYRHLRESSLRIGRRGSILASVLINAFLFAVIHPQGLLGVPLLMSIAVVLAISREWRGSLLSPTITHMIVNGITTTIVLLAFR